MNLLPENYEKLKICPWCGQNSDKASFLYWDYLGCDVVKCKCGCVYARRRLNDSGRDIFWKDYMSRDHEADEVKTEQRHVMYQIEYDFLRNYVRDGKLLDVGCGKGDFMELFHRNGFETTGVEFGKEAYEEGKRIGRNIKYGELPQLDFDSKYDLIVFRGTIQYFPNPKQYFDKAISLLNSGGYIYINYINTGSYCFNLFLGDFSVPITGADYIGYDKMMLHKYFCDEKGMQLVAERDFYRGTPYEDLENDILKVAEAIECKKSEKKIATKCPAFFENMMGVLFRKQ